MKRNTQNPDAILDDTLAGIRGEVIETSAVEGAASRVWARVATEQAALGAASPSMSTVAQSDTIQGCNDFQSLIPFYLRGELSDSRRLLLEDHTHECIPCRKALKVARAGNQTAAAATVNRFDTRRKTSFAPSPVWRWAVAATLVVGFALVGWVAFQRMPFGDAMYATVHAADGPVYRVSDTESVAVKAGDEIRRGDRVRTAKDAAAVVRLSDGSLVEMKERSEFSVSDSARGTTINLARGNVIVEAAKQREKHLYVATDDALVSVTGTIFSVNNGTKGSRVSVVEGEVRVNHNGKEDVLHPGDQTATHASLEPISVKDEIAWSRDAARYGKLLGELAALKRELDQKVPRPGVRNSSRLLALAPEGTVLYAALPNLSATITESYRIMQERINQNDALREWWQQERKGGDATAAKRNDAEAARIIETIREAGEYIGNEIVITATMDERGEPGAPLVLAELKDAAGFRSFLERQLATLPAGDAKHAPKVRFIADPLTATATTAAAPTTAKNQKHEEVLIWINNDTFAAAPKLEQLQKLASAAKDSSANGFASTPFYARIAETYKEGAGLIVAADLEKIIARATRDQGKNPDDLRRAEAFSKLGLSDLRHFIVEYKDVDGKAYNRASLIFNEKTSGIASWLAAPGPMGSLDFISPDANVVAAFVVKEPVSLVGDLLDVVGTAAPEARRHIAELEKTRGIDIRRDIAAPLGGEIAIAIDGPIVPTPSWKVVIEVHDPARLQQTFGRIVEEANREAAKHGLKGLQLEETETGGRKFYMLQSLDAPGLQMHYAYVNGYMVAAPSRVLVTRAIGFSESEQTLSRSPRFISTLPSDKNANFSALFYYDIGSIAETIAQRVGNLEGKSEEREQAVEALRKLSPPTLAYAYAQGDRIVFSANSSEGAPFGLSPAMLFGMPASFGIRHMLDEGVRGGVGNHGGRQATTQPSQPSKQTTKGRDE